MPNEYDSIDEQEDYQHHNRCHGGKLFDGKESRDKNFDLDNYNGHGNVKLQNQLSHDCPLKNSRKYDREKLRMIVASDQHLEKETSHLSRTRKSRSPLTNRRLPASKFHKPSYETIAHNYETHPDHERFTEKTQRKKHKENNSQDCMETINEDDELMKIRGKRMKNTKVKSKIENCLGELDELKNELTQFEYEKMTPPKHLKDKKKRNANDCLKVMQSKLSDDDDDEEESKFLEGELAKISFCEPCSHPKHSMKTGETTSATETSIVEEIDGRAQRNIRRVIDDAIIRENAYSSAKNGKHMNDAEASSEATYSDHDDNYDETLRGSQDNDNGNIDFITELKNLKWRYLNHIQDELYRLYDLERFLDTLSTKKSRLAKRNHNGNGRPARCGAHVQ